MLCPTLSKLKTECWLLPQTLPSISVQECQQIFSCIKTTSSYNVLKKVIKDECSSDGNISTRFEFCCGITWWSHSRSRRPRFVDIITPVWVFSVKQHSCFISCWLEYTRTGMPSSKITPLFSLHLCFTYVYSKVIFALFFRWCYENFHFIS